MRRNILCLVMATVLLVGNGAVVRAEDYQGSDLWTAEFNGTEIVSNFTSSDLSEEAENIQPGDSITLKVNVKNTDAEETDWYMTNQAVQSLEDAKDSANGGAYEYRLMYTDAAGVETTLYDSETVGGETSSEEEGLHQATDSMKEYFYLDRLKTGESGVVTLRVKVNGETIGNGYQQTLAKLQMTFAVEKVTAATVIDQPQKDRIITNVVQTGDHAKILLFSVMALLSGLLLLIMAVKSMKDRADQEGEV